MINEASQFYLSLITAIFIGGIAGYLGSLMITRRMSLVSGPLGHMALPGVALGLIYGFDVFWGALATIALGSIFIWLINFRSGRLSIDTITAVVFSSAVALGFLVLPIEEAERALIGDISQVTLVDTLLTIVISVVLFIVIRRLYFDLMLSDISESLALSRGIHANTDSFFYLIAIAIVVAIEVKIVGILLTAALMAIPAAAANNVSRGFAQYRFVSLCIGVVSTVSGVVLFQLTGLAAGPLMILTGATFFVVSLFFVKKMT